MGINKFITFVDKHVLQEFSGKGQHLPLLPSISPASDNRDYVFLLTTEHFLILAVLRIQAGDLERILLMPGGH